MAIERDPVSVATGGLAGLLGTTFSPIPPTPADEQRREAAPTTPASSSGQIINIPSFKPTGVTPLPSPLLIKPETVSKRHFRGIQEEAFGPRSKLDEVLDRIGEIIKEQVYLSKQDEGAVTAPFGEASLAPLPTSVPQPASAPPPVTVPLAPVQQQKPVIEPSLVEKALPPIIATTPQQSAPLPPPPLDNSQTRGGGAGQPTITPDALLGWNRGRLLG